MRYSFKNSTNPYMAVLELLESHTTATSPAYAALTASMLKPIDTCMLVVKLQSHSYTVIVAIIATVY